jgi:hypothetical protein
MFLSIILHSSIICELAPWNRALKKLTVARLVNKLPAFYGTGSFVFTTARHFTLS